jgi:hypothetical protein
MSSADRMAVSARGTVKGRGALLVAVTLVSVVPSAWAQPTPPGWIDGSRPGCRVWNPEPRPDESVVWTGSCANGFAQGHGTLIWLQNTQATDRFSGEYRDGRRTGRGVYIWSDGERYEGEFRDDKRTGRGVYTWPGGRRYEGSFRDGHFHGHGAMTWADGSRYDGQWQDSRAHGSGSKTEPDGSVYTGQWVRGCFRESGRTAEAGATRAECDAR